MYVRGSVWGSEDGGEQKEGQAGGSDQSQLIKYLSTLTTCK